MNMGRCPRLKIEVNHATSEIHLPRPRNGRRMAALGGIGFWSYKRRLENLRKRIYGPRYGQRKPRSSIPCVDKKKMLAICSGCPLVQDVRPYSMVSATALEDHLEEIRRLVESGEKDPRTHTFARLAELYQKTSQLDRALEVIEKGLEQHPHYLNARLVHASVLRELDRLPEARRTLERVLQIDSGNIVARTVLIEIGSDGTTLQTDAAPTEMLRPHNTDASRWLEAFDVDWRKTSTDDDRHTDVRDRVDEGGIEDERDDTKAVSGGDEETRTTHREGVQSSLVSAGSTDTVLDTATLASLYVEQGFFAEAIKVYERLLSRSPHNSKLAADLEHARQCAERSSGGTHGPRPD